MKKLLTLAGAVLLAGALVAPAVAGDGAAPATPPATPPAAPAAEKGMAHAEVALPGTVPQAQIDIVEKREEARQRRDELLKIRAQAVQAGD